MDVRGGLDVDAIVKDDIRAHERVRRRVGRAEWQFNPRPPG